MLPEISVILPAYNVEEYIDECMESILRQTFQKIEVLIINDGSKDGTLAKAQKWSQVDKRIKVIDNENQGAGASRNCGLQAANGKYVIFIDPDDSCNERMLEKLHTAITSYDADIALCDYYEVRELKKFKKCIVNMPDYEKVSVKSDGSLIYKINPQPWNKLFRKALLLNNDILFPTKFRREDMFVTCCSVLKADGIVRVSEPLYCYKVMRPGGATHTNVKTLFDVLRNLELINKFYMENKVYEKYSKELEMVSLKYGLGWYGVAISRCRFKDVKRIVHEYSGYFKFHFEKPQKNHYYLEERINWSNGQRVVNKLLFIPFGPYILYFLFKIKDLMKR